MIALGQTCPDCTSASSHRPLEGAIRNHGFSRERVGSLEASRPGFEIFFSLAGRDWQLAICCGCQMRPCYIGGLCEESTNANPGLITHPPEGQKPPSNKRPLWISFIGSDHGGYPLGASETDVFYKELKKKSIICFFFEIFNDQQ